MSFLFPTVVGYFISARYACRTRDTRLTRRFASKLARSAITAVANRAAYELGRVTKEKTFERMSFLFLRYQHCYLF